MNLIKKLINLILNKFIVCKKHRRPNTNQKNKDNNNGIKQPPCPQPATLPHTIEKSHAKKRNTCELQTTKKVDKSHIVQTIPFLKSKLRLNYYNNIFVTYNINNSTEQKYPLIRAPKFGCEIKLPIIGRCGKRGVCEQLLCNEIEKLRLSGFYDNLSLFIKKLNYPYEPDLAYIDTRKGIFIDIEIDEPYSGLERMPIHYKTDTGTIDDKRNDYFTERGWTVIRFSENQVYKYPTSCIKRVYQLLHSIDSSIMIPQSLCLIDNISTEEMWTENKAKIMEQNKEREKLLCINKFIKPMYNTSILLNDYEHGKEIEINIFKEELQRKQAEQQRRQAEEQQRRQTEEQQRRQVQEYEHHYKITTQSQPKTTPSSRGYA